MNVAKVSDIYAKLSTGCKGIILSRRKSLYYSAASLILIGLLDYFTGPQFGFFVFYYIPILFAGWFLDRKTAIFYAFTATLVWWTADSLGENIYGSEFFRYWNSFIRLLSFLLVGVLFSSFRLKLENERKLNGDLKKALADVRKLSGLLPICASCKNIRNDKGYWQQIEGYIKEHSEAEFSHSICPDCMEKLYPAIAKKIRDKQAGQERHEP